MISFNVSVRLGPSSRTLEIFIYCVSICMTSFQILKNLQDWFLPIVFSSSVVRQNNGNTINKRTDTDNLRFTYAWAQQQ